MRYSRAVTSDEPVVASCRGQGSGYDAVNADIISGKRGVLNRGGTPAVGSQRVEQRLPVLKFAFPRGQL